MTHPWITIRLLFRSMLLDAIDRGAPVSDTAIELSKTLSFTSALVCCRVNCHQIGGQTV
jgi:hypothetical protein